MTTPRSRDLPTTRSRDLTDDDDDEGNEIKATLGVERRGGPAFNAARYVYSHDVCVRTAARQLQ